MENNSQISSIDFLRPRSVSTGLGLSLDNTRIASTGDSSLLSLIADEVDRELQQQEAEMDRFLKIQVCSLLSSNTDLICQVPELKSLCHGCLSSSWILRQRKQDGLIDSSD